MLLQLLASFSENQRVCLRSAVPLWLLWLQHFLLTAASAETVFFNQYGHCNKGKTFDLHDEAYKLISTGGTDAFETKVCVMTFHSNTDGEELCLNFKEFSIANCQVSLKIYKSQTASGRTWETLTCNDKTPGKLCTDSSYVTVALNKERLVGIRDPGYKFEIDLGTDEQLDRAADYGSGKDPPGVGVTGKSSEGDKTSSSLVAIVVCVLLVIVLLAAIAAVVLFCCRQKRGVYRGESAGGEDGEGRPQQRGEGGERMYVEPSAPPPEEPPPPYEYPPPYTGSSSAPQADVIYENTPMMKNR